MVKIYIQNNYFKIVDINDSNRIYEAGRSDVLFKQKIEGENKYYLFIDNKALKFAHGLEYSDFLDENDNPFSSQAAFDEFITTNTASSGGGGGSSIPSPPSTGDGEYVSINGVTQWDTRPYTVDSGTNDQRNKGDLFVSGEVVTQQGSVFIGNVAKKSTNNQSFEVSNGSVYFKPRIESNGIGEVTTGSKETVCYKPFTKDDPQGNQLFLQLADL